MKYTLFLFWGGLFLLIHQTSVAQTGFVNRMGDNLDRGPSIAKIEQKALQAQAEGDEYQAMDYYSRILKVDSNHVNALRGFGAASLNFAALAQSKWAYQRLLQINPNDFDAQLKYAEVLFREGLYDQAKETFRHFQNDPAGKTTQQITLAQQSMELCDWAKQAQTRSDFSTKVTLLDTTTVNTEHSEYMNYPADNGDIFFSSYRFPFKGDRKDHRKRFLVKVMTAADQADGSTVLDTLDFNEKKKHTMHVAFNREGNIMIYTIGEFINSAEIRSQLFMRRKQGAGWGEPAKLSESINLAGYTATEPNFGALKGQSDETLFFVSDRPNGKGGRDIWYSTLLSNGSLTEPANLEIVNTPGDDVTPFYHTPTGTLYFSTNGRENMGGFDVYKIVGYGLDWATSPTHLAPPVNSYANDVFFTMTSDAAMAYFSSNRLGATNISEEACCYDIFSIPLLKPKLVAVPFDAVSKDSLERTNLRLFELRDGQWVQVDSAINIPGRFYPFSVNPGEKYRITATKPGFKPDTTEFITPRKVWPGIMSQHLFLGPMKIDLIAQVFDKKTKEPILGATARFEDLGPVEITGSKGQGESRVNTNPVGNDFKYPLQFERNYKVLVSKSGYTVDSFVVSTAGFKRDTTLRDTLYLKRGVDLEALAFDITTSNPVPLKGVRFELFELPKKAAPQRAGDEIRPLDHQYRNALDFGTRYMIVASKPGFSSDTIEFNVNALTTRAFETIRQELNLFSLDLENYLPIRLYFDNDRPDRRTLATTTKTLYSQAYFAYYPKKDTFLLEYTKGMTFADKDLATKDLEVFFEDSLKGEWNRLRFFTEVLFEKLKHGDSVIITLKGFASPRAANNYNKNLTSRRIMSVMNHFENFDGALLRRFIASGQLVVREEPNGEEKSRKGVNDKINDPRNSVFSPSASKERRVEIIGIQFNKKE